MVEGQNGVEGDHWLVGGWAESGEGGGVDSWFSSGSTCRSERKRREKKQNKDASFIHEGVQKAKHPGAGSWCWFAAWAAAFGAPAGGRRGTSLPAACSRLTQRIRPRLLLLSSCPCLVLRTGGRHVQASDLHNTTATTAQRRDKQKMMLCAAEQKKICLPDSLECVCFFKK